MNLCSKPYCCMPGAVALSYDYATRVAVLDDPPTDELSPHSYALCSRCADRLRPPLGWELIDRRDAPPLFLPFRRDDSGDQSGVAFGHGA